MPKPSKPKTLDMLEFAAERIFTRQSSKAKREPFSKLPQEKG